MNKYIEVILPEEAENLTVYYQKVCERENFDIAEAEGILKQAISYEHMKHVENEELLRIEDVEDGIYQIHISGDEEYEFAPMLVSMPATRHSRKLPSIACQTSRSRPRNSHSNLSGVQVLTALSSRS